MRRLVTRTIPVAIIVGLLLAWTPRARQQGQLVAGGMTRPLIEAWNRLTATVGSLFGGLVPGRKSAAAEARDLAAKLREAEAKLAETDALRRENNQLRLQLALPKRPGWRGVVAEVIARDPVTWNRGFRIGRGTDDGIVVGGVVLSGRYVLGRVSAAGKASALVETVGTPGCKLSVVLTDSGSVGVLWGRSRQQWRGPPECTINYLPKDVSAAKDELVVTSGLGGTVPDGLVVGRVSGPVKIEEGTHASVRILPAASFRRVNFVTVLCPTKPASTP
jgi:rod shape-determining protein MreC